MWEIRDKKKDKRRHNCVQLVVFRVVNIVILGKLKLGPYELYDDRRTDYCAIAKAKITVMERIGNSFYLVFILIIILQEDLIK